MTAPAQWQEICDLADIVPDTGVCAQVGGLQIAVFRVDDLVYAIDNGDPASGANVLSRGIVGDLEGELVVASPLYKQHFSLITGRCLEEPNHSVSTYPCRVVAGTVQVLCGARSSRRITQRRRLVVVGNGMAGMRTVEELLEMAPNLYDIEVFGAEPHGNYNRILLSPVLSGEKQVADIMLHPFSWYEERGVKLHPREPVVEIDRIRRRVRSERGTEADYDRLLLATGSNPIVLQVPGSTLPGVVTFRDLNDVALMLEASRAHAHAIVIGGGLLGLEAANGLRARGMHVTVVHLASSLMERQLDGPSGQLLRQSLEQRGIEFKLAATTTTIHGDDRVTGVGLADGTHLAADLVVMAIGIRPNVALAKAAGICCERGVLVDDTLLTFDPSVYAVGECVQHRQLTYGLVGPLWEQARVCAAHLAEVGITRYRGSLTATNLKVTGINVFSAGNLKPSSDSESLVFHDSEHGIYKHLILENDQVRGAVLYGDTSDGPWYAELMQQRRSIGPLRKHLLFGREFSEQRA
jgi:NAD(P)H-dependent nitrite reductase small subunit